MQTDSTRRPSMVRTLLALSLLVATMPASTVTPARAAPDIPLPEHPRPDFQRAEWQNLNGPWSFLFDEEDIGEKESWFRGARVFPEKILVPFPWGSELSGVEDRATIAWYSRAIRVPAAWKGRRVFLVVGACDWHTKAWLDGRPIGSHRGGYTPFEFEITEVARPGDEQPLVLRVDDSPRPFKLEGKQGYGNARGIWQTVYLEARPAVYLETVHFTPDIDSRNVKVKARLSDPAPASTSFTLKTTAGSPAEKTVGIPKGRREISFAAPVERLRLWTLDDPFLYEAEVVLSTGAGSVDRVSTYFGMREIGVVKLPGSGHPYVSLNGTPVYLQLSLDQAYHREGFYTYPSDEFVRDEILRSRRIGLNGNRIHVKIDPPRKLYWADRLGLLIMADVPNSWGQPDEPMRREIEHALRGMISRDYNHPSIFSWVIFNETWGLRTGDRGYLPETQEWVASMYHLAKSLDPTRLVEDNSPCNNDHVVTDINSWHAYLPGYGWKERLEQITRDTYPGSGWNYIGDYKQGEEPLFNSECGNVWGYEGSTGDVDWSWDYHIMINQFRRFPKVCGWLYTEHHDVINEWNGYYRFDRSGKITGLSALVEGMGLEDLHSPLYISPGLQLCEEVKPGSSVEVPLYASFLTDSSPGGQELVLRYRLHGWNLLGEAVEFSRGTRTVPFSPWKSEEIPPLELEMPGKPCLAVLALCLEDGLGNPVHRNFTTFLVRTGSAPRDETLAGGEGARMRLLRFQPDSFHGAEWSLKQWNVLEGAKVNGAGSGWFEYRLPWPKGLSPDDVAWGSLRLEASAKQLFGKDRKGSGRLEGDFMRGRGTHDPSLNPNSYPMTDTVRFPSAVRIRAGSPGRLETVGSFELRDDPADHRGILSWHFQKRDRRLREAGSYGYLLNAKLGGELLRGAAEAGEITLRLEVDEALPGGLAIYGERFGRYPMDPTVVLVLK